MAVVYPDYPYLKFENWWSDEGDVYYGVMFNFDHANNSNLEVIIPNEIYGKPVKKILDYGFSYVTAIRKLTIPSSIIDIGTGAFQAASGFVSIKVDSDNPKFTSDNNCLIEKINENEYKVIRACNVKNISVPTYITSIDDLSFADNKETETVHIPESVTYVGIDAFGYCDSNKLTIYYEGASVPSTWHETWNLENCEVKCGTYKVTLMSDGEEINTIENQFYFNNNLDDVIPPGKIPLGYKFYGLFYDENFQQRAFYRDALTEDTTIYVKWEPITYNVTYNLNGGVNNAANPSTFTINNLPLALHEPTKAGYRFLGWYKNVNFSGGPITEITTIGDKDLYARWELITYTITYNSNGGTVVPQTSNATQLPDPLPTTIKSGYIFVAWYYDSAFTQKANAGDTIESNVTLYAKWELITYTITYNSNGGTLVPDLTEQTALPNPLPIPIKENHTFLGWYYDSGFTIKAFADDPLYGDVTLYARWELITYTITYNSNGGSAVPQTSNVTQLPNPLPTPTKENHTFLGWYYDSDFTNKAIANDEITENVTLYAKWQSNIYLTDLTGTKWKLNDDVQVWFDLGVPVGTFNINFTSNGNNYTSFTVSHHPGNNYNFIRYDLTIIYRRDMPANNGTWTNNNYKVIEITGGTDVTNTTLISWLGSNATQIIESSGPKPFEVGDILPAGHIKISWDFTGKPIGEDDAFLIISDGDLYIEIYEHEIFIQRGSNYEIVSADTPGYITITLTEPCTITTLDGHHDYEEYVGDAFLWEVVSLGYSITFEEYGGTTQTDLTDQTALPDPLPIPTKEGYTFVGWYYDSDFTNKAFANDPLTSDVTLYAKWELNTYTITFNSNGGTTISDIEDATELPTPLPTPTKSGYTFLGWFYDSDFTNEAFASDSLTGDVTLYAKWELITYTITYNSNGGSIVPQTSNATQLPDPLPTPTKKGYTFVAWYYESNFQTRAKAGDMIEEDTTLYAKWHTLGSLFTEIADAIREKESSSEPIRDVDFGERINSLKTYEVVETLAELELLEPKLNRLVYVKEGSGELATGEPIKITQDGDTLIIG